MKARKVVVFDLDDTLYNEIDYLKSAYLEISEVIANVVKINKTQIYNDMLDFYYSKENCFERITDKYNLDIPVSDLLNVYRNHKPTLDLSPDRLKVLNYLKLSKVPMGILTDGRSVQQRNKIKALGIEGYFDEIVISEEFGTEKPNINNFRFFETTFGVAQYYYIGDNLNKDFVSPNKLKWITICLKDNGQNIHSQNEANVNEQFLAHHNISKFSELIDIVF
ncbi:HAD family hydrolase [Hwangdonia lutea]|uniref:HAD family hydrolase n=1 Tax=Hwangdonia lutea TaxID=3075823 RepID=A0AA97HPW4_9FLAO|nr:HAD family hydrolase [Hwangdonia sp. SCSIO 19198]WOD43426.1 HAD family hydrolase [Hwangdonia sp. SCSIO 19198]